MKAFVLCLTIFIHLIVIQSALKTMTALVQLFLQFQEFTFALFLALAF